MGLDIVLWLAIIPKIVSLCAVHYVSIARFSIEGLRAATIVYKGCDGIPCPATACEGLLMNALPFAYDVVHVKGLEDDDDTG